MGHNTSTYLINATFFHANAARILFSSGKIGTSMPVLNQEDQSGPLTLLPQGGKGWKGFVVRLSILAAAIILFVGYMIAMPGRSYFGQPIQPSLEELRVAVDLHKDVV